MLGLTPLLSPHLRLRTLDKAQATMRKWGDDKGVKAEAHWKRVGLGGFQS